MKGLWDSTSIIPITLSLIFLFIYHFEEVLATPTRHLCRPEQRDALVSFKNEFEIGKPKLDDDCKNGGYPKTESWGNKSDCCKWEGITCNAKSGEVIELDLSCSRLLGRFRSNSSLFRLQNLLFLDLSLNDLNGQIPFSIDNLPQLTSLNLSHNQFSGQLPYSLGNLSQLNYLRLSGNQFFGQIPYSIGNLSHLTYLTIFWNNLVGEIPSSFGNLNQLTSLYVSLNKLSGNFPTILLNLTGLLDLHIAGNQFNGPLPLNISSLSNLMDFYGSYNAFTGTLPSSLFTIPSLFRISLADNQLNGSLEFGNISSPSNLQWLDIDNNNLIGPISRSISKLVNLELLALSHFNTQGPVDFSIFSHLKSLKCLFLSDLNTTTTIDLNDILSYFKRLGSLDLSGNHVLATNKSLASDHPLIYYLNLSGCGITHFPEFLRSQQLMETVDISNNKIKGQVFGWLWTLPKLEYVNLSNNTFIGFERLKKPGVASVRKPSMMHLLGSNNNFTGKIPSFICSLRSLSTLDLSDNNFNGSIPRCMGNHKRTLSILNLCRNNLSGGLPEHIFESLRSLDVGHNQLVGKLPRFLIRFYNLEVLNVESNRINDTFPFWLSSLQKLQVLVLRSNAFHGPIDQASFPKLRIIDISHNHFNGTLPSDYFVKWSAMSSLGQNEDGSDEDYMGDKSGYYHDSMVLMNKGVELELVRILKIYTAIDFSGNKLEGDIPESIGLMKELHVLNLSNNGFTGHIPSSMGNLTALESLDVSQNKLSGVIPQELGNLSFLAYMNFSHNKLTGLVPGGTQFRTQACSSFEDNLGLFGSSLDDDCRDIYTPTLHQQHETPKSEEEEEKVLSWTAAAIGFGPGIAFGLTIGYILVSYKPEWFRNPFGRKNRRRGNTTIHKKDTIIWCFEVGVQENNQE